MLLITEDNLNSLDNVSIHGEGPQLPCILLRCVLFASTHDALLPTGESRCALTPRRVEPLGFYRFWDVLDGFKHDRRQQIDVGEEDGSQVSSALMFIHLVPPPVSVSASVFFSYGILVFLAVNSSYSIFSAARARARTHLLH